MQIKVSSFCYEAYSCCVYWTGPPATLHDGTPVAVKVQYPGVADSISNDLDNLSILLRYSGLLPRGLFLDNTIRTARKEMLQETGYEVESQSMERASDNLQGGAPSSCLLFKI
eukprot:Partr_v1_DN26936_c1_g1_i1_m7056 putative AarF domain containing kinase